nr:MAG TPA: hypothetical protein [Caudoviricetes sp.]
MTCVKSCPSFCLSYTSKFIYNFPFSTNLIYCFAFRIFLSAFWNIL